MTINHHPDWPISNCADVIDSRDIIARIEELEEDCDTCGGTGVEAATVTADPRNQLDCPDCQGRGKYVEAEDPRELEVLRTLAAQCEGYAADWQYGETLIRATYFEEYAQELAEDCGMISGGEQWPLNCIDWEQAARELAQDYTNVDFDGVEYLIR